MGIEKITIGQKLEDEVFVLKSLVKLKEGGYRAVLSDKTGEINASISDERFDASYSDFVGGAVHVNALVVNGEDAGLEAKIKSLCLAKKGEFKPSELFDSISEEKIAVYINVIKDAIGRIPDASCKALCHAVLTDEVLAGLAKYPASIGYHARFRGGALAATAEVTALALQTGIMHQKAQNGLYEPTIEWSILLSGALLHLVAVLDYFEDQPWHRTAAGVDRGYMSLLQSRIERTIANAEFQVDDALFARLLNVLQVAQPKALVKATTPAGVILRHCQQMYFELDMLDSASADHTGSDAQFFETRTKRFINQTRVEEERSAA